MKTKRILYIEFLRIFACLCVLFIHSPGNLLFMHYGVNSLKFWVYQFFLVLSRSGVPVFFMISGAMLIKKDESLRFIWENRIAKTFVILFVFSALAYIGSAVVDHNFSIVQFFTRFYGSYTNVAYWYLYSYIAMLMSLPFLKAIARNITDRQFWYMIALAFVLYELRSAGEFLLLDNKLTVTNNLMPNWLFSSIVLYPCLGYYFAERFNAEQNKKRLWILIAVSLASIALSCIMTGRYVTMTPEPKSSQIVSFHKMFEMILAITVFVGARVLFETGKVNERIKGIIIFLGKQTLGIYLIHMFVVKLLGFTPVESILSSVFKNMKLLAASVHILIVFLISLVLSVLAEKALQFLRKSIKKKTG